MKKVLMIFALVAATVSSVAQASNARAIGSFSKAPSNSMPSAPSKSMPSNGTSPITSPVRNMERYCSYSKGASQLAQPGVLCRIYNVATTSGPSFHEACFPEGTNCNALPQVG